MSDLDRVTQTISARLPDNYEMDYVSLRNLQPTAWVEIKCRTNPSTLYTDYMLSLGKWESGVGHHSESAPFVLIVRFTDGTFYYKYDGAFNPRTGWGGRKDRNDKQDMEQVVYIPMNKFILLYGAH